MTRQTATLLAGIPARNMGLYHRIRFLVGESGCAIELSEGGRAVSTLILRHIEMDRARSHARVDRVACPAEYPPECGLSGDRETATAQAAAGVSAAHGMQSRGGRSIVAADLCPDIA